MTSFVKLFNAHIDHLGVTNQKLAEVMDVHHTTIARWRKEATTGQKQNKPEEEKPIQRFAHHYRLNTQELDELLASADFKVNDKPINQQIVNPFITGQPVRYGNFYGRQAILESLFSLWRGFPQTPMQNAAIIGDKRSGKTSLLMYLRDIVNLGAASGKLRENQRVDWLSQDKGYNFIFVDFQDARLCNQKRLLSYILQNMQLELDPEILSLENSSDVLVDFTNIVEDHLNKPTIILLDEFNAIVNRCPEELDNNFWESLRSLSNNLLDPQYLGFVLAANKSPHIIAEELNKSAEFGVSPFFNIFGKSIVLGHLERHEAEELIASSPSRFSQTDIDFICDITQCQPFYVQKACQTRLDALMFNTGDWKKSVESFMQLV
ncbi:ATP-binding protein [Candidatus Albibeggiatoa sp. nov. NOAA]|uniref:ATP-binding protein n=1 Tax=Candidatus Albibeggiatoa sp. nov. NOAA TaxID=3162724 RepID=UPI0032F7442E|nr:ATP-binding protein [Thiotrichaceae bacterium]